MKQTTADFPPLRLLLLGFGNVAQAFLPLLASRSQWLGQHQGIRPVISGVGTRSQGFYAHPTGIDAALLQQEQDPLAWFRTHAARLEDAISFIEAGQAAGASLLIELTTLNPQTGQPALTHIRTALQAGMHVITANKGPLAYAQADLLALARRHNVQLRFESTVMDGLPLINLAQFTLQAVGIRSFRALPNATSTLVLHMIERGHTFEEAISQAQHLGVAEADPSYDLEGWDAVMKTTILANTLLEGQITPAMVKREGITHLSVDEIRSAAQASSPIRLLSRAWRTPEGQVYAEVSPQRIDSSDILHTGKGSIISLETEAMGTISLIEHEPMVLQTAYGVLSDLIILLQQCQKADTGA